MPSEQRETPAVRLSRRERVHASLRVLALLAALAALASGWCLHRALADADVAVQRLSHALASELGPELIGAPETLSINGQTLTVAVKSSALDLHAALDRFTAHCSGERRDAAASSGSESALLRLFAHLSVLRRESNDEGRLLCFAPAQPRANFAALFSDLSRAAAAGDLSLLGQLRYVSARRLKSDKTQLVVVWADGPLRMGALLPEHGDAPGSDMQGVPRPPDSTRELSVQAAGRAYGLRLYRTHKSGREQLAFYDRALSEQGWSKVQVVSEEELVEGVTARAFVRAGQALAVSAQEGRGGQDTQLALIDLGGRERMLGVARAARSAPESAGE